MAVSLGGGKGKQKTSQQQSGTNTFQLDPATAGLITGQIGNVQNRPYQAFNPASIDAFRNPYQRDVIDATLADFDAGAAQDRLAQKDAFARSKMFGDDRRGIYEAELDGNLARARGGLLAGLNSGGYDQALAAAMGENQNANQYEMQRGGLLTGLLSLLARQGTETMQGKSSGTSSGRSMNFGFTYGG